MIELSTLARASSVDSSFVIVESAGLTTDILDAVLGVETVFGAVLTVGVVLTVFVGFCDTKSSNVIDCVFWGADERGVSFLPPLEEILA